MRVVKLVGEQRKRFPAPSHGHLILAETPELAVTALIPTAGPVDITMAEIPAYDGIPWFVDLAYELPIEDIKIILEAMKPFKIKLDWYEARMVPRWLDLYNDDLTTNFDHILKALQKHNAKQLSMT